jgi:hypothetical protein
VGRLLALVILFTPLSLFAAEWSPYVGAALQYDLVIPIYGVTSATNSGYLHEFASWGSQFEVGTSTKDISIYGAYHFSASPDYGEHDGYTRSSWKEKRALLGARWLMNGSGNFPVKPVVGMALSYGKSRLGWVVAGRNLSRYSQNNLGVMLEFGLLIRTHSPLEFVCMAQTHRIETGFGNDHYSSTVDHFTVTIPSIQLGIHYVLPSFHLGR